MHHRRGNACPAVGKMTSNYAEMEGAIKGQDKYLIELETQRKLAKRLMKKKFSEANDDRKKQGLSSIENEVNPYMNGYVVPRPKSPSKLKKMFPGRKGDKAKVFTKHQDPLLLQSFADYDQYLLECRNTMTSHLSRSIIDFEDMNDAEHHQFSCEGITNEDNQGKNPLLSLNCQGLDSLVREFDESFLDLDALNLGRKKSARYPKRKKRLDAFLKQFVRCCGN